MMDITLDKKKYKDTKLMICTNCGNIGHDYKHCREPITSWGIVLVKLEATSQTNRNEVDLEKYCLEEGVRLVGKNTGDDIKKFGTFLNTISFLLVRRKHSLGYVEFVRGRYLEDNIDGIIYLFKQMTPNEIQKLGASDFDEIWNEFWGNDIKKISFNKDEYTNSKKKFNALKTKMGLELGLDFYVKNVKSLYMSPEWGFPKGRKLKGESDIDCAMREFSEETGLPEKSIKIISNVKPIIENMTGTNGIDYRHIYYLAEYIGSEIPFISDKNNSEIGGIGFFEYDFATQLLREYHVEKKNIIKNVFLYYFDMHISKNGNNDKKEETFTTWKTGDDF